MEIQEAGSIVKADSGHVGRHIPAPLTATFLPPEPDAGLDLTKVLRVAVRSLPLLVCSMGLAMALAYFWSASRPRAYQASFDLLISTTSTEGRVVSDIQQNSKPISADSSPSLSDQTLLTILRSPKLLSPAAKRLAAQYPDITYDLLAKQLVLENPKDTNILRVSYTAGDPKRVRAVMQVISQTYLNYSLANKRTSISQGVNFVEDRLPSLKTRVDSLQLRMQNFRQSYNLSDPNTQSEQLSVQISNLNQQQYENQIALQEAQASYQDLKRQFQAGDAYRLASATLIKNANYQKIRNQLLDLDNQIAQQASLYSDEYPSLVALREHRQRLLPLLNREAQQAVQEMESGIRDLQARRQALAETRTNLLANMKQLSIRTRQFNDLKREVEIATTNLTQFLNKRESLRIEAAQQQIPWELTTPPTPAQLVQQRTGLVVALGGILGLLLGLAASLFLDKLKDVFHAPDEIKAETILPLLGVLPYAQEVCGNHLKRLAAGKPLRTASQFIEAVRSLYTNIRLLNVDNPIQSLTISSVSAKDGKTTVAIQLALSAAALGQRVLLVDADLRHPSVHSTLGLGNQYGLMDLMYSHLSLDDVIQTLPQEPSFFVLTAGQVPPDPLRILTSEKMKHLSIALEQQFDLVIYDSPPALGIADATVLANRTDGLILVVGLENTGCSDFADTLESLSLSSTMVHGVIVNGWKGKLRHNNYFSNRKLPVLSLPQAHA